MKNKPFPFFTAYKNRFIALSIGIIVMSILAYFVHVSGSHKNITEYSSAHILHGTHSSHTPSLTLPSNKYLLGAWNMNGNSTNSVTQKTDLFSNTPLIFTNIKNKESLFFNEKNTNIFWKDEQKNSTEEVTIEAWFNAQQGLGYSRILELGNTSETSTGVAIDSQSVGLSNGIRYWLYINNKRYEAIVEPQKDFHDGEWHHIVLSYNGKTAQLYIDGKNVSSKNITGSITSETKLHIGSSANNNHNDIFIGNIDDVKIYNKGI